MSICGLQFAMAIQSYDIFFRHYQSIKQIIIMTSTTNLLLITVAAAYATSTINGQKISQSSQQIKRPKRPLPPSIKGIQSSSLTLQQQYQKKKQQRALQKLNLLKQTTVHGTGNGGAFNPNLAPNSQSKVTHLNAPSDFNPCPSDTTFSGNRASYDCTSYIYCSGGTPKGDYISCIGLSFDNEKGVCDWKESVYCESIDGTVKSSDEGEGSESSAGGEGVTNVVIGSTTAISTAESQNVGSVGATSNEKSDWGGHWVGGKWYVVLFSSVVYVVISCMSDPLLSCSKTTGYQIVKKLIHH